ncbi:MAG: hypothetical protein HAW67_06040 [Endozoicomonadaceae bacterium]|nr:hypothetical protein [Endozoicomonadaceae bacterium]
MNENYKVPVWSQLKPSDPQGNRLKLLSVSEAIIIKAYLLKKCTNKFREITRYDDTLFHQRVLDIENEITEKLNSLMLVGSQTEPSGIHDLNKAICSLYTYDGWKKVRDELRQVKKRLKNNRIEVSENHHSQLIAIKEDQGFDSMNDVIDLLLQTYKSKDF